jgi:hypothetical protein
MRWFAALAAVGCAGLDTKGEHSATGPSPACALAEASQTCPSCTEGPLQCTFGATAVIEGSCGECQARHALYQALCDAGEAASADAIEAQTVCVPVDCEVRYACDCSAECVAAPSPAADPATATATTTPCTCATPPTTLPGTCEWNGAECTFQ